jgi:hypothetical protein
MIQGVLQAQDPYFDKEENMNLINGDKIVTLTVYDSENDIGIDRKMSIIEFVNETTPEGVTSMDLITSVRLTNRDWIDLLSSQFDISRSAAKNMLHCMMSIAHTEHAIKQFNGRKEE